MYIYLMSKIRYNLTQKDSRSYMIPSKGYGGGPVADMGQPMTCILKQNKKKN